MTNKMIVEYIYKNFNVVKMIEKLIHTTNLDQSSHDLAQEIYIILLNNNNKILNTLYKEDKLKAFINQIILNNRNYYRSWLNLLRNTNNLSLENPPDNSKDENHDYSNLEDLYYIKSRMRMKVYPIELTDRIDETYDDYDDRKERETEDYKRYRKLVDILKNENFGKGVTEEDDKLCQALSIYSEYIGVEIINNEAVFKEHLTMKELSDLYVKHFKNGRSKKMEVRQIKKCIVIASEYLKNNIK